MSNLTFLSPSFSFTGLNAELTYRISEGGRDSFSVDPRSGVVSVSGPLDFDRRPSYDIRLVAVDGGVPALSGTATLTVSVMNKNDKVRGGGSVKIV